jgi:hypothetical protein
LVSTGTIKRFPHREVTISHRSGIGANFSNGKILKFLPRELAYDKLFICRWRIFSKVNDFNVMVRKIFTVLVPVPIGDK